MRLDRSLSVVSRMRSSYCGSPCSARSPTSPIGSVALVRCVDGPFRGGPRSLQPGARYAPVHWDSGRGCQQHLDLVPLRRPTASMSWLPSRETHRSRRPTSRLALAREPRRQPSHAAGVSGAQSKALRWPARIGRPSLAIGPTVSDAGLLAEFRDSTCKPVPGTVIQHFLEFRPVRHRRQHIR